MKDEYDDEVTGDLLTGFLPQLTFTYGGLKCDLDSRVLSTNGAPIPGKNDRATRKLRG